MPVATAAATTFPLMLSVSGCRGIFGQSMTPEVAARFGAVYGGFLRARTSGDSGRRPMVVIGRDGRLAGDLLMRAASAGIAAAGCDVLEVGVAMTPTIGVMVDVRGAAGGVVLTASHNPQEWNGLKPIARDPGLGVGVVSAGAPNKAYADQIVQRYHSHVASVGAGAGKAAVPGSGLVGPTEVGEIHQASPGGVGVVDEAANTHLQRVREALGEIGAHQDRRSLALKAVLDSVNSSGRIAGKELLGARLVHHLGAGDTGIFPHTPEPTRENLGQLCKSVVDRHAHVGFAQDPDADRLAIVDEMGRYIGEEYTLVLCAQAILGALGEKARGRSICINLSTSRMIEDVCLSYGVKVFRTAVGEANVVEAMKANNSVMGGEGNGGVIWPAVTYIRDSLGAMALVMALMARTGKTISQLVSEIPSYAIVKKKVDLKGGDMSQARAAAEAVKRAYAQERIDTQDGVRVDFDNRRAWLHVRGSNTEPIMRLIAEAPTTQEAEQILAEAGAAIAKG